MTSIDEIYMREALRQAQKAFEAQECPVGAVIVSDGQVVARAHHQTNVLKDPTAHATMIAVTQAASALEPERLRQATAYTTVEPCAMCAGALFAAQLGHLVFGASDPREGACGSVVDLSRNERLNHHLEVKRGVLEQECAALWAEYWHKANPR